MSTYVLLGELEYGIGNTKKALELLNRGIAKINSTDKLSNNMTEALALVTRIVNETTNNKIIPGTTLKRYINLQQQQLIALQGLKDTLDRSSWRYHVQVGVNEAAHEQERSTLYASMATQKNTYHWALGLSAIILAVGFVYAGKQKRKKKEAIHDKDTFIAQQVKE